MIRFTLIFIFIWFAKFATAQVDVIKFVCIGPIDAPIHDIVVSKRPLASTSFLERSVVLNKDAFNQLESFVNRNDTKEHSVSDKNSSYTFSVRKISGRDSTYYLLNGQNLSTKYFKELRSYVQKRNKVDSTKLVKELDLLIDRIKKK